ncbi:MAG: TonB-dependent receptor [Thermoflavifilum aggregans]|nr:TonB-dependent receptor [Thermoflavifilum aggregans]
MKHTYIRFFSLLLLMSQATFAQVQVHIHMKDSLQQPLYGTAVLVRDSAHLYSGITDSSGSVALQLPHAGTYSLHASLLGYLNLDTMIQIHTAEQQLDFVLKASPKQLAEVVVRTENVAINQQGEKFIVHFVNPNFIQGRSIWDVLKSSPLILTDNDENLSVLNNSNVVIFINGKRQYISMQSLVEMLKARPADDIQQLEIIPMPTAQYNVPQGASIINIVFKKGTNYTKGYVNSTSSYRSLFSEMLAAGITHQKEKWSYDINAEGDYKQFKIRQKSNLYDPQLPLQWTTTQTTQVTYPNLDGSIQLTYQPGKNSELTLFHESNYVSVQPDHYSSDAFTSYLQTMNGSQDSTDRSLINRKLNYYEANSVLQYDWTNTDQQKKFEFILSHVYVSYDQSITYLFQNLKSGNLKSSSNLYQYLPSFNNNISARISYTQPIWKKVIFSIGMEYDHSYAHNQVNWSQIVSGQYQPIDSLNLLYQLPEDVYEGFFNFQIPFSQKFSLNAGMRASHTRDNGKLNGASVYDRHYNNFIPILQFSYQPSQNHQFTYSLEDGIYRPSFWDLVPYFRYSSSNVITQNAASLQKTTYFKNFLTYTYRQKHVFMLYNNFMYHPISNNGYPYVTQDGKLLLASTNLKYDNLASVSYNSSFAFFKGIWNLSPYVYVTYHTIRGKDSTAFLKNDLLWMGIILNSQLTLSRKKMWFAQIYPYFTTPSSGDNSFYKDLHAIFLLNVSLIKKIKNWTLLLQANDLANTSSFQTRRYIFQDPQIDYRLQQYFLMPQFQIRISWNFGNQKISSGNVNTRAIEEIKRRAGTNL